MPRLFALLVCLVLGSIAWAEDPSPEPDDNNDAKLILGTWQAVKGVKEGTPAPAKEIEKLTMEVTKDKLTLLDGGKKTTGNDVVSYTLDMKSKPRGIDLTPKQGASEAIRGIYKIEKGELTIVFTQRGGVRPQSFDEKGGSLLVFRKAKAKK